MGWELPWWYSGKESTYQCRRLGFNPWVGKITWRRKWQPAPVFLPGKAHGQRSLAGYSLWGCRVRHDLATKEKQQAGCDTSSWKNDLDTHMRYVGNCGLISLASECESGFARKEDKRTVIILSLCSYSQSEAMRGESLVVQQKRICMIYRRYGFNPWIRKIPCRRKWQPNPVFLLGRYYGQRNTAGYSCMGFQESDTTYRPNHRHYIQWATGFFPFKNIYIRKTINLLCCRTFPMWQTDLGTNTTALANLEQNIVVSHAENLRLTEKKKKEKIYLMKSHWQMC